MTVVWLTQGEVAHLNGFFDVQTFDLVARLFTNDVYSGLTTAQLKALTEADFTEPTWAGYQATPITSWTVAGPSPSTATNSQITFTCIAAPASPQAVHGWWAERTIAGDAMAFEVFALGPYLVSATGDTIAFQPTLSLD